jgi:hypothetical protein
MKVRKQIKNVKLRNVYYRLINNEFYSKTRLKKLNITQDENCERCHEVETIKHLLWECTWSQNMWKNLNNIYNTIGVKNQVQYYEDIFNLNGSVSVNMIKLKLVNELIQIERPKHLEKENIIKIIKRLQNIEKYIAIKNNAVTAFELKWKDFVNLV